MPSRILLLLGALWLGDRGWCAAVAPSGVSLKDLSAQSVSLEAFRGKPVLLEFWATWCDSCLESTAFYEKLSLRYSTNTLTVLAINEGERAQDVSRFKEKNIPALRVLLDLNRRAYDAYGVRGLPTAILLDASGKVVKRWPGFGASTASEISAALGALGLKPGP